MTFEIIRLKKEYENSYKKFILKKKESFMYYSLKFRDFLTDLLGDESEYLIAVNNDEVVGCMPIFYRNSTEFGIVANSLPYYGGHGGPIAENEEIMNALLCEYVRVVEEKKCVASTVIGSPLEDFDSLYKNIIKPDYIDERIELMTYFPYDSELLYNEALMNKYHAQERRGIRKAIKNDIEIELDYSQEAIDFLHKVHTDNMLAVGGLPKDKKCFDILNKHFVAGKDYDVYVAKKDKKKIAALLVFYFNGTVEYYTPAIIKEYRNIQPLPLIIYTAMNKAMEKGFVKWNWGGTGLTQKSLYDFKSKWGTTETRYYYYTRIMDDSIMRIDRKKLMGIYSNYYVYPFNQVEENEL